MKLYAALLVPFFFITAPLQAQYNLSVDEMIDLRGSGVPILDPKLSLLINDVIMANFRAVEFHNDKFVRVANEVGLDSAWVALHESLVARWAGWDKAYSVWFVKKRVEASSSIVSVGGVTKVRSMETEESQNMALLRWGSVLLQIAQLNENKAAFGKTEDLGDLWSDWMDRISRLDKAINKLRKY